MLTTREVCECSENLTPNTLGLWVKDKIITPTTVGRRGYGKSSLFSNMQAIGAIVACSVARTAIICHVGSITKIFNAFANTPEYELEHEFSLGNTHLVGIYCNELVLRPYDPDCVDVKSIYDRVKAVKTNKVEVS